MKVKDIAGLSQPLTKLIEVISGGIGTIYKPRAMRKEAEAEAYKKGLMAKAEAKKILLEGEAKIELLERAKARLVYQELTRQTNIEEIAEKSIKYLGEAVSEEPVDEDWRTRFFKKAQDVTNEEMQEVWAKILANEVTKPGTISYRTLDVISNLSKHEAELFQTVCSVVSSIGIIYVIDGLYEKEEYGLIFGDFLMLKDAGLVHNNDNMSIKPKTIKHGNSPRYAVIPIADSTYNVTNQRRPEALQFEFEALMLTIAGMELYKIVSVDKNKQYFKDFFKSKEREGYIFTKKESGVHPQEPDGQ